MKQLVSVLVFSFLFVEGTVVLAQNCAPGTYSKRIVILGSSTAAGNGATIVDSSWVGKLQLSYRKNTSDGNDTCIENRALQGSVTYNGLPTGYPLPGNRTSWPPDPNRNVTWVLALNPRPNIVIVSYPTNDIFLPNYDMKETMDNLRLMFQQFNSAGIRCFVASSQPRNDQGTLPLSQRQQLRQLLDSINNNFGVYAIDFYNPLVTTDGTLQLKPEVNSGDNIHPNNLGHRLLFQQVQAKNIFAFGAPLPIALLNFQAQFQNRSVNIKWKAANEEPNSFYEIQRTGDGRNFQTLFTQAANQQSEYSWTDQQPLNGKSFYRLKISEPSQTTYSRTLTVLNNQKQTNIVTLYADLSSLHVEISSEKRQNAVLNIVSSTGAIIQKQSFHLSATTNDLTIAIGNLSEGAYFLQLSAADGTSEVQRFTRLK